MMTGLTNGSYNVIVYANDTSGNIGFSERVYFAILGVHDLVIIDIEGYSGTVYAGKLIEMAVLVLNNGTCIDNFNITAFANAIAFDNKTVADLCPSYEISVIFLWT